MPSIGPMEMLVVAVVALIVFGPQRLPEIARTIGRTMSEFRRQAQQIRSEFESELDEANPMKDLERDDESEPVVTRLDPEPPGEIADEPEGPPNLADDDERRQDDEVR